MKTQLLFFLASIAVVLSSCSSNYKYFTEDLYDEYRWSNEELERIQFYVSEDIVLYSELAGEDARISDGKIRVIDGREVEEVLIEKGTPGVFVQSPKKDRFAISFEDDPANFLMFGPNPKANGRFVLLAKEWNRRTGKVSYADRVWSTSSASAYSALMVDIKLAKKTRYKTKKAEGKRVGR